MKPLLIIPVVCLLVGASIGAMTVTANALPTYTGTLTCFSKDQHGDYYVFTTHGGTFHLYGLPAGLVGHQATATVYGTGIDKTGVHWDFIHVTVAKNPYPYDGRMTRVA